MRYLTDREARALREDSLSAIGNVAIKRLRPQPARIYGPVRERLFIAPHERRPKCRACQQPIANKAPVIRFYFQGQTYTHPSFMHQECPSGDKLVDDADR